jgi:hypothetical protein
MTGHGGARPNSGRPKNSKNKATLTREAIEREAIVRLRAVGLGNQPPLTDADIAGMNCLEIMSYAMAAEAAAGRWVSASDIASRLAPFRFAKLSSVENHITTLRISEMSDEQLQALVDDCDAARAVTR